MNILTAILVSGIIATYPADNAGGRLLSIEDVTVSRKVYPTSKTFYWTGPHELGTTKPAEKGWELPVSGRTGIVYGSSVSRNEFGCEEGVFPSNGKDRLAVYRKDESRVTEFPLLDINSRTGDLKSIRYPMNGMKSEILQLCVCDTLGNVLSTMEVTDFSEERYLTNVSWSPDDKYIFIQVLDRSQHEMHLNMYRSDNGDFVRTLLSESNDAWVEPRNPLHFIKGTYNFIYTTDNRDGYSNLYLCDTLGTVRRLTEVDADVQYAGNDGKWLYYTSAEVSPIENHLFRMDISRKNPGKPKRLTKEAGMHVISMSPDCTKYLDKWQDFNNAGATSLHSADGKIEKYLVSNYTDPLEEYARCEVELGSVKAADGVTDNYYRLIKPLNFDPDKKYPLIVYVYGGPHSQMVNSSWLGSIRMWEMLMAQKGYVVYVQDNRGTSNRGAAFEKAINRQCGQVEMADQIAGLNSLLERSPWIDRDRIGVHGWSYGGFMTISLAVNYPDIFKVAVAGGPVIDWKWYEVMYGERYMDTEETNPEGFARTSLIGKASQLKAKLLICQGMLDNTVVPEHSLSFVQDCIVNGVQLDYFPYPTSEHNMRDAARVHLYRKITDYFTGNL